MKCKRCDSELPEDAAYCPKCGKKRAGTKADRLPDLVGEDYRNGMKMLDLEEKYGASITTIYVKLNRLGVKKVTKVDRLPDTVGKDYRSGMTLLEVARKHGVAPMAICKKLNRLGVGIRSQGSGKRKRIYPKDIPRVIAMHRKGISHPKIGLKFGVGRERIRQIVAMAGEEPRATPRAQKAIVRALQVSKQLETKRAEKRALIEAASAQWKQGAHWTVLAELFGLSNATVVAARISTLRKRRGAKMFPFRRPPQKSTK